MILRHTLRSFSKLQRNLSTLPILLLHGPHLWPNVATLDGRVNLRDVLWNSAVMREHILESGKMTIDTSSNNVTSCNPQQTAFQQVLESIIGGRIVQVIHQSLDGCSVWLGTTQLLNCQANVLVGAGATADMAGSAGCDKQTLATNHLLLGQGGGLALLVHLKSEWQTGMRSPNSTYPTQNATARMIGILNSYSSLLTTTHTTISIHI